MARKFLAGGLLAAVLPILATLRAQTVGTAATPILEVASVRLAPPSEIDSMKQSGRIPSAAFPGNKITVSAMSLVGMVRIAYDVRVYQVSPGGPSWINDDAYDVEAKAEGDSSLTLDGFRQLLQTVLADRFHLIVHRETKEIPVYALVVGSKGARLTESKGDKYSMRVGGGQIEMVDGTIGRLTGALTSYVVDRPVLDRTGLTGTYDLTLRFAPEPVQRPSPLPAAFSPPNADPSIPSDAPSLFTAVQDQLDLKLESIKAPVELLFIDHVERPSGN